MNERKVNTQGGRQFDSAQLHNNLEPDRDLSRSGFDFAEQFIIIKPQTQTQTQTQIKLKAQSLKPKAYAQSLANSLIKLLGIAQ